MILYLTFNLIYIFGCICIIYLICEIFNYYYYLDSLKLIKEKEITIPEHDFDYKTMIEYFQIITKKELIEWLENSLSYNYQPDKNLYYNFLKIDEIKRTNFLKWVSYHIYFKSFSELTEQEKTKAVEVVKYLEEKHELTFEKGYNKNVFFPKFRKSDIKAKYKPFILYIMAVIYSYMIFRYLKYKGYKWITKKSGIIYIVRDIEAEKTIYFVHGLGIGISPYLKLLDILDNKYNMIIPLLPNISNMDFKIFNRIMKKPDIHDFFPCKKEWIDDFKELTENYEDVNFVGHSFGTIIYGLLHNSDMRDRIKKRILIDPVCFIRGGYKIYQYLNQPYDPNYINKNFIDKVIKYFIYDDLYVRYVTSKVLYGPVFFVELDEIENHSLIILSELDAIVPIRKIEKDILRVRENNQILKTRIKYRILENTKHGEFIFMPEFSLITDFIK
jgi:hypothetical protein